MSGEHDMDRCARSKVQPMVFLLGPPGAGKTALGSRACEELGLEFLDLAR